MRFFVALEIPSKNLAEFQTIQNSLQTLIPQARLTALDKIHLTLAFIGQQPGELRNQLTEVIKKAAISIPSFKVTPAFLDGFPNIHHPKVIWVGIRGDIDKIMVMAERVRDGLALLHLSSDERRFIPHISIAKLNSNFSVDRNLEGKMEEIMADSFNPIKISAIKLFESIPSHGFHKHNTLAEVKLS